MAVKRLAINEEGQWRVSFLRAGGGTRWFVNQFVEGSWWVDCALFRR